LISSAGLQDHDHTARHPFAVSAGFPHFAEEQAGALAGDPLEAATAVPDEKGLVPFFLLQVVGEQFGQVPFVPDDRDIDDPSQLQVFRNRYPPGRFETKLLPPLHLAATGLR
jgi:hypothetical protein